MYIQNLVKFYQLFLKILSGNEILTSDKGHNSVTNVCKIVCSNPNIDLANINANTKFGKILIVCSEDIQLKRNYDGQNDGWSE